MTARHSVAESSRGSRRPELERQCTHSRLHAYVSSQVRQMGAASPSSSRSTRDSGRRSGAVRMDAARSPMAWPLFSCAAPDTNVTLCHNQARRRRPMASTREWFETVAEARRRARRRLPRSVFLALEAGSEKGTTLRDNVAAFSELGLAPPRIADRPATRATATSVLGQDLSLPVIASPTGVQAVHPEGEVAVARGAAEAGTAMGLSSFASVAVEEVVTANPKTFFQLFWIGDRDRNLARVQRARAAGAKALIVTLDWSFATSRDWGSPPIPETMNLQTMQRVAPEGLTRPGYVLSWLRHGRLPELTVPNMSGRGESPPSFFGAYGEWMQTPPPSWADIGWLRGQWDGPFMVKGVMRPDDARRAADAGATAARRRGA